MRRDDGELRRNWTENEAVDWMSAFDDDPVTELGQEIISLIGCFSRFPAGTQRWGSRVCADRKVQFGTSGLAEVSRYFLHRLEAAAQTECGWAGTLLEI